MTEDLKLTDAPREATPEGTNSGCACCAPTSSPSAPSTAAIALAPGSEASTEQVTQGYAITGMTCGHCVGAITQELSALDGVSEVRIDLVAGGTSTAVITSTSALSDTDVAAAVDEAGYELVGRSA